MHWLDFQINNNPDKIFIREGNKNHSYLDVYEMVKVYSRALMKSGIKRNDKIMICLPSGIEMVETILACFEIGAIAVPISIHMTSHEHKLIMDKIKPSLIITNWQEKKSFSSCPFLLFCIEELPNVASGCSIMKNAYEHNNNDICVIILTSGTTSTPKAVQLTYGNFEMSCKNWNEFLLFEKQDQFLCCLPLNHIGGLAVIIRALIYGFSVNLISDFDAINVNNAIANNPVTIISLVPTMLKRILSLDGGLNSLKSLRYILLGGGPSPESLLDYCIENHLPIVKVYGMTETCSGTFGLKVLEEPHNKLYAGRPFSGIKAWINNGTIHISGDVVMVGYLDEEVINGVHDSNDLGHIDNDLLFLDIRRKDLIVSGGENINPMEVEEQLISIDGILDSAVVGEEDEEWGQRVIAYVVFETNELNETLIKNKLIEVLSKHKIPKKIIKVPLIPRNELGKIIYGSLNSL